MSVNETPVNAGHDESAREVVAEADPGLVLDRGTVEQILRRLGEVPEKDFGDDREVFAVVCGVRMKRNMRPRADGCLNVREPESWVVGYAVAPPEGAVEYEFGEDEQRKMRTPDKPGGAEAYLIVTGNAPWRPVSSPEHPWIDGMTPEGFVLVPFRMFRPRRARKDD